MDNSQREIEVERITISIGDKRLELTVEECVELCRKLEALLGREQSYVPVPYVPYPWPYAGPYVTTITADATGCQTGPKNSEDGK